MTKLELIALITESFSDFNEDPFDYETLPPLTLKEAEGYLKEYRDDEDSMDLDQVDRLPDEVTPALYQEAYNCYLRMMKHECQVIRLAEWITETDQVCLYDNFYGYEDGKPEIIPTDFLFNTYNLRSLPFEADHPIDAVSLIKIGQNSPGFDLNMMYFWYDRKHNSLHSTDAPFKEGLLDARSFAEFILSPEGKECLDYTVRECMDENEYADVFRSEIK